jgi:hypothetical protein
MKKSKPALIVIIFALIFSFLLAGTVAAAGEYIPTPTRNPKTPPPTPTSGGGFEIGTGGSGDSFECPPGGVEGYGQVTPDALWLGVCGHCLPTDTPYPTFDLNQQPEVPSTSTPVIYVSGTPATPDPNIELTYTPVFTNTPFETVTAFPTWTVTPGFTCNYLPTPSPVPTSTYPVTSTTSPTSDVEVDDPSFIRSGSGWGNYSSPGALGNYQYLSNVTDSTTSFTFTGTRVRLYSGKASNLGICEVLIDGNSFSNFDLYGNGVRLLVADITGLTNTSHTVTVRTTGTKNASSSGYFCGADSVLYTTGQGLTPTPYPTYTSVPGASTGVLECPSNPSSYTCLVDQEGNHAILTWTGSSCAAGCLSSDMSILVYPPEENVWLQYVISAQHRELSSYSQNRVQDFFSVSCVGNGLCNVDHGLQLYSAPGLDVLDYNTWEWMQYVNTHPADPRVIFRQAPAQDYPSYGGTLEFIVEIWTSARCVPNTPIPVTSTPYVGTNYCSSVNNGMGSLENQTIEFWDPVGPPACLIIPSYNTDNLFGFEYTTWFQLIPDAMQEVISDALQSFDVVTPAMTICLQGYEFMPVNLFGNILLIQTLADIGLGLYIISTLRSK